MAYIHGVHGSEVATSLVAMTEANAGLPVVVGTAPVHLAQNAAEANKPILCYTYKEFVEQMGFSDDFEQYTLCEAAYVYFVLFNMAPLVAINVLDPAKHGAEVEQQEIQVHNGVATIDAPVVLSSLKVKGGVSEALAQIGVDYTAAYNDEEKLVITILKDGTIPQSAESIYVAYRQVTPAAVTADDIIGGIDVETGAAEGLELIDAVYPKFGLIPGVILAPGYSQKSAVAAVMRAKASNINGLFKAISLCDADSATIKKYSGVSEWKNQNNYVDPFEVVCWPRVTLGGVQYNLSTQLAGVIAKTDAANGDIPHKSPSNENLQADGCVTSDGLEVTLDQATAAYLNSQGVVTALNWIGGWKAWGNRTAAYPSNTDVKDSFIAVRRMFNWINNTLITTFWSKIDDPTNKRLIRTIMDSANIWLNGLASQEYILGGRVEFREEDNPLTNLLDGKIKFHVYVSPAVPARDIEFVQEYDPSYLNNLFSD